MHKCFRTILTIAYIISIVALCYGIYQCILLPKLVVTIIVVSFIITAISISLFIYAILFSEVVSQSLLMGHIDFCDVILNVFNSNTVKHTNFKDPSSVHSNTKKPLNKVVQIALKDNIIKDLYTKKIFHIDELKLCNFDVRRALQEKFILNQFINKKLTINDLRRCHTGTIEALRLDYIQDLFLNGKLTWDNLIDHIHNYNTISALANDNIRNMFIDGHLELDQITQCDLYVEAVLNIAFFRNQLINKDMTWDEIMKTVHVEKAKRNNNKVQTENFVITKIKAVITKFFDDPKFSNIVDETKRMKFLKDIKSNSNENPYLNALHDKLNRYIELELNNYFGPNLNEYFSTKALNSKILNQEEMKIFIKDKINTLLHQYNTQMIIRATLSLFHSPKDKLRVRKIRIQPRKRSFQNVHIATRT